MERRLAAILAADVVGYSRLMGVDEAGTLAALKAHRSELVDLKIAENHGRIFKLTGDGLFAEFPSVVNAVTCAVEIQRAMRERISQAPVGQRIEFRMGVNLGDVIVEGGDILGDGVNVAARLEGIAEPGGIAVSATVRDHVGHRLGVTFADGGEQKLKNIELPIRVYHVYWDAQQRASIGITALPLPDRPSIAVLPFANVTGDPEQRYFSDGITEDLITELSRFRSITVIARTSSFVYRDKPVDVRQIGRELGADYIVEGSVRRAGDRIRITAQLVEAASGKEVWAQRYDRNLGDLFAVQDAVTKTIVGSLPSRIEDAGARAAGRKRPENLSAYECYLRGRAYFREFDPDTSTAARDLFHRAIALDPTLAPAYAQLAFVEMRDWWGARNSQALENAFVLAQKAVQLDENDGFCQLALGYVCLDRHQLENAALHIHQGLALNPNDSYGVIDKAELLAYLGEPNEALSWIDHAFRLDPFGPQFFHSITSMVLFCARDYVRSILSFGRITRGLATPWNCVYAIASHGYLDQREKAQAIIAHYHSLVPNLPLLEHASHEPFKHKADLNHLMDGLRKAGVPD